MTTKANFPLILFAKEPIAGKVKTRLQSHCSPKEAMHIAKILLQYSLRNALKFWPGRVIISVGVDDQAMFSGTFVDELSHKYKVEIVRQVEGDLGERMHVAFTQFGYPAAIMGTDVPHCPPTVFEQAWAKLQLGSDVIGPCEDGGYYLIGLQQQSEFLFKGIAWGSDQVLSETLRLAQRAELELLHLPALYDLDHWQDLERLASSQPNSVPEVTAFVNKKLEL